MTCPFPITQVSRFCVHLKGPKGTVTFYRSAAATFLGKDAPKTESNAIGQCRPNVEESIQVKENLFRLKKEYMFKPFGLKRLKCLVAQFVCSDRRSFFMGAELISPKGWTRRQRNGIRDE